MKNWIKLTLILAFFCSLILVIILDSDLFYDGRSYFFANRDLPFEIKPVFDNEYNEGFYFEDKHGFSLVTKGDSKYLINQNETYINVKRIQSYGYSSNKLIVEVQTAADNNNVYLIFQHNKKFDKLDVQLVLDSDHLKKSPELSWKEINLNESRFKSKIRNWGIIICIVLLIFNIVLFLRSFPK